MIGKLNKNALILSLSNNVWVAIVLRLDRYLKVFMFMLFSRTIFFLFFLFLRDPFFKKKN
jgi:hypothetical protein